MMSASRSDKGSSVRLLHGRRAAIQGLLLNMLLAGSKLVVGYIFNNLSVQAEGFNNLSDLAASIVLVASMYFAAKPADHRHPFGHQRMEYVSGLIVGSLILLFGFELALASIRRVIEPVMPDRSPLIPIVLCFSIAVKMSMFVLYKRAAKRMQSDSLRANIQDSINDVFVTSAVLLGYIVNHFVSWNIDAWLSLLLSIYILVSGFNLVRSLISVILGEGPAPEFLEKLGGYFENHPEIIGFHDVMMHTYGSGKTYVTVHCEIDANLSLPEAHAVIESIEHEARRDMGIDLLIHIDPSDVTSEPARRLRRAIQQIVGRYRDRWGEICGYHDLKINERAPEPEVSLDLVLAWGRRNEVNDLVGNIRDEVRDVYPEAKVRLRIEYADASTQGASVPVEAAAEALELTTDDVLTVD
ncbi:MAG: cation transporter [Clostridiaceae bacterium]|jgi:cation diffusion facilitator family transporter|nr:cation transporter [Clostridiaceae bacterium]